MKRGAFVAVDGNQRPLGAAAWLSRANNSVQVALPARAPVEANANAAIQPAMAPVRLAVPEPVTSSRSRVGLLVAMAVVVVLLFVLGWRRFGAPSIARRESTLPPAGPGDARRSSARRVVGWFFFAALFFTLASPAHSQRQMERLGRGIVAVRSSSTQVYVGWRLLGNDPEEVAFNLYRAANGGVPAKLNAAPLTNTTDYLDTPGSTALNGSSLAYSVRPVLGGLEVPDSWAHPSNAPVVLPVNPPTRQYLPLPLQPTPDGAHRVGFVWIGDLDGDGEYDYVMVRNHATLSAQRQFVEAYLRNGTFLWRLNLGFNSTNQYNIEPGSSSIGIGHGDNLTVYDMDGDGRAEVILRTANGVQFGNGATVLAANNNSQFLSIVDGMTGVERTRASIPNPFLADGPLQGHMGIFYADGTRPTVLWAAKNRRDSAGGDNGFQGLVTAWNFRDGALMQLWSWNDQNYYAPEGHQIRLADVDHDGRDEFIDIGYALRPTGTPLYNISETVHGDRFHLTDIDPERAGLETYLIQQNNGSGLATALVDAGTGQSIKKWYAAGVVDVGRGVAGDFSTARKGYELFSTQPNTYDAKGDVLYTAHPFPPEAIWWDGDLLREFCATVGSTAESPAIDKFNPANPVSNSRLFTIYNESSAPNGSYWHYGGRAPHHGDLFGDWREEVIVVADDNSELRIYTTKTLAGQRLYTLQHNAQYRIQQTTKGYVQASCVDYYLGVGMEPPPAPFSNARLVWRGGGANNWDAGATANWFTNNLWVSNNTPVSFGNGDSVLFDISGSNHAAINLTGSLTPGEVTVHSPKHFAFSGSGSLDGAMKLTKAGAGRLTLDGTNSFTGRTLVAEGALVVNGALLNSPVAVRGGVWLDGRLAGRGVVGAAVTLEAGAGLSPGAGTNAPATLTLATNLLLRGLTLNDFDLSDDASGATRTNDLVNVAGSVTLQGTNTFVIRKLNDTLPPGVYPLINYSGTLTGSVSTLRVSGLEGLPVAFTNPPGQIALVVRATRPPATLKWTGGLGGNAWDLATTSNWLNGATKDMFVPLDTVRFDNIGGSNLTVILIESLITSNVVVDSTSNYTFTGSGALLGAGGLVKSNSGTLAISTLNNAYTGRTVIGGGTVSVPELDAVGFPSPLGNPSSNPSNLVFAGDATLRITGESYTDRGLTLNAGTNTLEVFNAADQVTIAGRLTGAGALRKSGPGTLALTASNSYAGGTFIQGGDIVLGGGNAGNRYGVGTGLITFSNGTLRLLDLQDDINYAHRFHVPGGGTGRIDCDGRSVMTGALTGGGTFNVWTPYVRTDFNGDWSAFTGQINVITDSDGGNFRVGNTAGLPGARMNLADDTSLQDRVSSGTPMISIGELSGAPGCNLAGGTGNDGLDVNWSVGGLNTSATFAGNTYNNIGLIKVGTGTWTLSGTNLTHSGATTVNAGTLLVNGNASNALGAVTVGTAGTLGGSGTVGGNTTVNGRLAPGNDAIGTLRFRGDVTFNAGGVARIEIQKSSGTRDLADAGGTVTYGGTLSVANLGGALTNGDSFKIFNATAYAGAFATLDLPTLAPGLFWDTGPLAINGTLRITSTDPRPLVLVSAGSVWKFHDLGTDLGVAWRGTNYNDSAWSNGPAMLGFGDANGVLPTTIISNRAQITFYFRRSFVVTNLGSVTNLALRLQRDDGAVVYLNSNEVWRSNLPAGAITAATRALVAVGNAEETQWFTTNASPSLLRPGTNVIAVEIHQVTNTSSDVAFDFEMIGEGATVNDPPAVTLTSPTPGPDYFTPASIALAASASDPDGLVARVEFYADGALLGSVSNAPFNFIWADAAPGPRTLRAVAYDNTGLSGTSAPVTIDVTARLIAAGSVWKYHDLAIDLGAAWRGTSYNAAAWASGPAELGFGDGDEATVISNRAQITFYFRQTFTATNPAIFTNLIVRYVRDDGAVVYLNSNEVLRSNMPGGTIGYATRASATVGAPEESQWFTNSLNPASLVAGLNILAVEIHQVTDTSSDVSFNLELTARAAGAPLTPPQLAIQLAGSIATLAWPLDGASYSLQSASELATPVMWIPVTNAPVLTGDEWRVTLLGATNGQRFFRLQLP